VFGLPRLICSSYTHTRTRPPSHSYSRPTHHSGSTTTCTARAWRCTMKHCRPALPAFPYTRRPSRRRLCCTHLGGRI
jgi:hypothetical protein